MECPNPPNADERKRLENEARQLAQEATGRVVFTDGLGALGVGSWGDGPAAVQQAAFDEEFAPKGGDA